MRRMVFTRRTCSTGETKEDPKNTTLSLPTKPLPTSALEGGSRDVSTVAGAA